MVNSLDYESKQKLSNSDKNKVTGEEEENTSKKECPLCKDEGRQSVIILCQIGPDTAIQICSYPQCAYPMGTEDPLKVKRSTQKCELTEEQHKLLKLPYSAGKKICTTNSFSDAINHIRKKFESIKGLIEVHSKGCVVTEGADLTKD